MIIIKDKRKLVITYEFDEKIKLHIHKRYIWKLY